MGNIVMFCILAVVIVASALLCVTTTKIMRAATYMLFVLFGVAGMTIHSWGPLRSLSMPVALR